MLEYQSERCRSSPPGGSASYVLGDRTALLRPYLQLRAANRLNNQYYGGWVSWSLDPGVGREPDPWQNAPVAQVYYASILWMSSTSGQLPQGLARARTSGTLAIVD
jgi:hypothetical protein